MWTQEGKGHGRREKRAIRTAPADGIGWAIENRKHYVRDVTFREHAQRTRTGNQPNAHAGIRNLVIGAFRKRGHANIAHARRYHGRDDRRILALYGYI